MRPRTSKLVLIFAFVLALFFPTRVRAQAPQVDSVSPTMARAGDQVAFLGSGFGATQGSGNVWLGNTYGVVTSWSDTQVVATVASGAKSGTAQVLQGGVWSSPINFTVVTPTVTGVSPTTGIAGTQVTFIGTGFGAAQGSGNVWLGNTYGVVNSWSDTQIVATVASGAKSGTAQVLQGGVWSSPINFTVVTPTVTSVTPTTGIAGTQVTFVGTGFGAAQGSGNVWLGNTYGVVNSWSDTQVVATVASGAKSGTAQVLQGGVWSDPINFTVTAGVVSIAVSPSGPTLAVAARQEFMAIATLSDGTQQDVTAGSAWSSSDTSVITVSNLLRAQGFSLAVHAGTAIVTATQGSVTGSTAITVVAPPAPPSIASVTPTSAAGNAQVTITGSGFGASQGTGYVYLGTVQGVVSSWSDNQIIATVAPSSTSGVVQVVQGGLQSNAVDFTVYTPTITSITPTGGLGGTSVTITGSNFGAAQGNGQAWLGTASAVVTTWTDSQIVATVAPGATSGNAQVLQNGIWSNAVPFTVNTPQIASATPNSGSPGTAVTIAGSGFGATQGSGVVWIGNTYGAVVSWSDTQIVATVASNALSGVVRIQQNGTWSNAISFTVPPAGGGSSLTIAPDVINMVVGDTHRIQAVNAQGQSVTGLAWTSSDTTVVSLSTDDPPILTGLAAGHVTITAGNASADVTVLAGPSLPVGTVQWSNPGDGSGVTNVLPAVPSASGVDVFAFQVSGNVAAITGEGTTAWTANVGGVNAIPDFRGGLVYVTGQTVQELDPTTGHPNPAYTYASGSSGPVLVHTDGTVFTIDGGSIKGIDPATGAVKFSVTPTEQNTSFNDGNCGEFSPISSSSPATLSGQPIIAGDGYAYFHYTYGAGRVEKICYSDGASNAFSLRDIHARLLRVGTDGSWQTMAVGDWSESSTTACVLSPPFNGGAECFYGHYEYASGGALPSGGDSGSFVTNSDQGAVYSQSVCLDDGSPCTNRLLTVASGGVNASASSPVSLQPVLQRADGTYVGFAGGNMAAFDLSGNIQWSVPNYSPLIATADGGVIAQSFDGLTTATFDANGLATGQNPGVGAVPTFSWLGNALYSIAGGLGLNSIAATPPLYAPSFAALLGGNQSGSGTSVWEVLSPFAPSSSPQKQLPPPGAMLHSNYNSIEILTTVSPDTIFSTYIQTFAGAGNPPAGTPNPNHEVTITNAPPPPVTTSGQVVTFVLNSWVSYVNPLQPFGCGLPAVPCPLQGPFSVQVERFDTSADVVSVATLAGHPLRGWRYWRVFSLGTNDIVVETGAVDTYASSPLNWAGYYIDKDLTGFQLKTWEDDLRYILRDIVQSRLDPKAVQGTTPQYNIVNGAWDGARQMPSQSNILYQVCQAAACD